MILKLVDAKRYRASFEQEYVKESRRKLNYGLWFPDSLLMGYDKGGSQEQAGSKLWA
jgi:hypothetical protein